MTDFQKIIDGYFQCWNDTDPGSRRAAIEALFTADAVFVDPMAAVTGPAAIDGVIGAVQARFPGFVVSQLGEVDGHHEQARFRWQMARPGEPAPVEGSDVITLSPTGQITQVLGFLDLIPA